MAGALEKLRKARQGSGTSLASPTITSGSTGTISGGGSSALAKLRAARAGVGTSGGAAASGNSALAKLRAARLGKTKLTPEAEIYASDEEKKRKSQTSEEKDVGGLFGGIGYALEKVGLGFLQGVEGVVDYAVGGIAELFGADDYSEDVIANDWLDYNHADEWYKPSDGWKFVGDVAGGIGTSLPGLLAGVAVTAATGGSGIGVGVGLALSGFSAAGTSTKEAYLESGELTGKQYGYGALMGGIEAGTEGLTGNLGTGLSKAVSSVSSALGKSASKTAARMTVKGAAKQFGKEFVSEAFEEGSAEIFSTVAKRLTYDKNAKFASAEEVTYVTLVGGFSGVVMGGVGTGARSVRHIASGKKIGDSGKIKQTLELGQMYADIEADAATGSASIKAISEIMPKLAGVKDGDKLTVGQRRMLGELAEYTTVAPLENVMRKSAITAVGGAEPIAAKLASDGNVKLVDGKLTYVTAETVESLTREGKEVRDITAEDITKGYDPENPASILKSLQDNEVLRYVAASDAAGRIMLTAKQLEDAALSGSTIRNQVDLNKFIEETNRSPERRAALGRELGISDNEWDTLQLGRFNEAIRTYRESGKADAYKRKIKAVEAAKSIPEAEAKKKIPSIITLGDGKIQRYKTDRVDIAVSRDGNSFIVYDYNSGDTSRSLTREETNTVLRELKTAGEANMPADVRNTPENAENSVLTNINQENMHVSGGKNVRYSIYNGKVVVDTDQNIFEGEERKDYGKIARSYMREHFRGKTFSDTSFTKLSEREYTSSRSTQKLFTTNDGVYDTKMKASTELDNMLIVAKKISHEDAKHPRDFNQNGYDRYDVTFSLDGEEFTGELLVAIDQNDRHTFYDIVKIKRSDSPVSAGLAERGTNASNSGTSSATNSILNSGENVNTSEQKTSEKSTKERIAEVRERLDAIRERLDAKKIDEYLRENVKDYSDLGEANRSMIRKIVREGRAHGLDDADVLSYARVAARSGLNIEFDANMKDGEAGYFDPDKNRIVVNPKTTKKQELILIHELDHAIRAYIGNDGKIHYVTYEGAEQALSKETRDMIKKEYADQEIDVSREELIADEASAYYAEAVLGGDKLIDLLLGNEPTLQKKLITFFTGAAQSYSADPKLAKAARAHYRSFKKMFADFSERNKGRNAETAVAAVDNGKLTVESGKSVRMSKDYEASLKQLEEGTFDVKSNTHIKVLEHTPKIFIDKAGAADREIIISWDVAFLAMKSREKAKGMYRGISEKHDEDLEKGHYHGLGSEVMAALPESLKDPIYIVKQDNGRICAITEMLYKKKRPIFAVIELDAYQTITQNGEIDADKYNLIVTVSNGQLNYIKNAILSGDIVYNKNNEDPAHFILRLKSLKKLMPTYDLAGSSDTSIPQNAEKSTDLAKKSSETSKSQRKSTDFEAKLADDRPIESIGGRDAKAGAKRASWFSQRRTDMTVGQMRQMIARYTGDKVYSSKEARETIDEIYGIFSLSGKNRAKLYEAMWQGYNSCRTDAERVEFSADMAEYVTVMLLSESSVSNPDKPGMLETISKLKRGIGHLTFDDIQKGDLKHILDKDGWRRFYSRWGFRETAYKNRRRYPLDEFITDFARENPEYSYLLEMTPQDAILELDSIYEQTADAAKQTVGAFDELSESEITEMIGDIGTAIYESFGTKGEKSTAKKVIEAKIASTERKYAELKEKYDKLYNKYYEQQNLPKKLLNLSYQIRKMKELQLGTFLNATDYRNDIFKETFNILGSIEFRGNIIPGKVRTAMQKLTEWYKPDNPVLKEIPDSPGSGYYSDYIALQINEIATGKGKLSMRELEMLDNVLRHATRIVENFNRVWKNGKWVEADETAKEFVKVSETATRLRASQDMRKLTGLFNKLKKKYLMAFGDPMTVFRYMDGYQDGFFTWVGEELRAGAFRHAVDVMEMKTEYDKFLEKDHKGYLKKASKQVVEYGGARMTKLQYISVYMTMQREQAQRGLAFNGFSFIDVNGMRVEVDGFISRVQTRLGAELGIIKDPDGTWQVSDEQLQRAVESEISEMKKQLSDEDLQFIGIIESTLNGKCKELKTARDMERLGFSNTISGYYYPIVRAMIAKSIDTRGMWGELDRASNISANKNTVKGAANALWIESVDTVFNRHIDAVARYAELSPAIDAINKIFNLDVSGNKNKPKSVRTATYNSWQTSIVFGGTHSDAQKHNGEAYIKDLLANLQGIGKNKGVGEQFAEGIRGSFAISALAANPKVVFTQLSSLFASTNILSMKSVATGMWFGFGKGGGDAVDRYCPVAKLRNYDSSAIKAQGVVENVRGVGEKLMTLVSWMDRGVVRALWGACQAEIESTKGLKIGSEENLAEAGKLLERVLQETQQNSIATEKSAAMRTGNWFMKSITMFTSDAMKGICRFIDAFGRRSSLKARIKTAEASGNTEEVQALKAELKSANKQALKSVGALITTALYMTLIARAFSFLYAKEDDEKYPALAFIADVFGGMIGGLPFFSDVYDFFTNGYEISDSVYDSLNDFLTAVRSSFNTSVKAITGEAAPADMAGAAVSLVQAGCTMFGLPFRNVRNFVTGIIRRISPSASYRLETLTESKNYAYDFEEAMDAGDEDKAYMILEMLLSERLSREGVKTSFIDSVYLEEVFRMDKAGYNIKPRTIGDSVVIGDEEVEMTPEEQSALRARYSEAAGPIEALIGSAGYSSLTDEQREKAVKFVYDCYYDVGIYELYGYERNKKRRLFSRVISPDKLALAYAATSGIESDYTDEGAVSGSRRKKVIAAINRLPLTTAEKLLIIAYKGYTLKDGDVRGISAERAKKLLISYILKMDITKDEKAALAAACGFKVKNGRISLK